MKRACAIVVMSAFVSGGCAVRGPSLAAQSAVGGPQSADACGQASPDVWRKYAAQLPIGATVRIRTCSRERLTAVLMLVDDTGIVVKPRTRVPEPTRHVPFPELAELEIHQQGLNVVKAAAIGGAVGGGAFLGLLMILLANLD